MGASWSDVKHDSALTIQKVIRGFLVRKSMKEIYPTITLIDEVERKVRKKHFMALIVTDSKERLQVLEQLMGLKIQWDSISTVNSNMSICKKSLIMRVIALREVVDTIAAIDFYNRHVSHCSYKYILVGSGSTCLEQLKVLEKSSDGFYLANMNLLLRGPGNSLSKKQSGHLSEFPIARLELDGNMLQEAHVAALITCLPPGRKPVKTYIIEGHENGVEEVYKMTLDELKDGGKIYLVFPITEQLSRLRAVSAEFESISHTFPDYKCGLLHGKLKSLDKEEALKQSRSGETHILLSTQVIKIGVDIRMHP